MDTKKESSHILLKSEGFTIVEILMAFLVLGIMSLGVISAHGSIAKMAAKMNRKLADKNTAQSVRYKLMDVDVCRANFQGVDLNSTVDIARRDISLGNQSLSSIDPNFKTSDLQQPGAKLKVADKNLLYDNFYVVNLELARAVDSDKAIVIPIFLSTNATGSVTSCASVMHSAGTGSGAACGPTNKGATRMATATEMQARIPMAVICDGNGWIGLQVNGGMYSMKEHDGNRGCMNSNPLTGECRCPTYYRPKTINGIETATGDCTKPDGITDHYYNENTDEFLPIQDRSQKCALDHIVCMPDLTNT